jgi:putative endonuclease
MLRRLALQKIALQKKCLEQIALVKNISKNKTHKKTTKNLKAPKTDKQISGQAAEDLVKKYLLNQGLALIDKNYHSRHGEIDLIFKDNDCIVFVEVRFRRKENFGSACETIDKRKQQKIIKAASHYLYKHRLTERVASRFDVIGITPNIKKSNISSDKAHNNFFIITDAYCKQYSVEWIKNAFQAF